MTGANPDPIGRKHRIVFLDRGTMRGGANLHPPSFPHVWTEFERSNAAEVVARCAGAEIVITNKVPISAATLDELPDLQMIAVAATGTDVIDIPACAARGIVVSNIRNYAINTVPEHTFALILALRRSIVAYRNSVRAGAWERAAQFCFFDHPIRDLAGVHARHHRRGSARPGCRRARAGLRHANAVLGAQELTRHGAPLYAFSRGP